MSEEGRIVHHHHESHQPPSSPPQQPPYEPPPQFDSPPPPPPVVPHYGTFQGVASSPSVGFPQPLPPPGSMNIPPEQYYSRGYQSVPGYAVADGRPVGSHHGQHRLPCCGIGFGWFLFIIGFFLGGVPWYAAAIIYICCRNVDPREKAAYVCCTIASVLAIIATIFGLTNLDD